MKRHDRAVGVVNGDGWGMGGVHGDRAEFSDGHKRMDIGNRRRIVPSRAVNAEAMESANVGGGLGASVGDSFDRMLHGVDVSEETVMVENRHPGLGIKKNP